VHLGGALDAGGLRAEAQASWLRVSASEQVVGADCAAAVETGCAVVVGAGAGVEAPSPQPARTRVADRTVGTSSGLRSTGPFRASTKSAPRAFGAAADGKSVVARGLHRVRAVRALLITQPGDGHFNPLVPVARALAAAGTTVEVATSPAYVADVERAGLRALGVGPEYRWDSSLDRWPDGAAVPPEDSAAFWTRRYNRDVTAAFVAGLVDATEGQRPDVALAEFGAAGWGQAYSDLTGVPWVGTAWALEPGYEYLDHDSWGFNAARAELGLGPSRSFRPDLWLSFTPPRWGRLDGPPLPVTRRFRLGAAPSGAAVPGGSGRPFVYGTLGTVFNTTRSLLHAFIAAIEAGGWSGLVTVGRNNDPSRFRRSERVAVEQYVPQADVLARTDVFLCHGGLGSMLGAMEAGCPMVVVPLGADQLDNAERARQLGLCVVVPPSEVAPERLRAAIAEVLGSERHQRAAAEVKDEIAHMPGLELLAAELQQVRSRARRGAPRGDGHRRA
jgi:UDP:flavonoid glycosyltransferase YjiC (YdhE family)